MSFTQAMQAGPTQQQPQGGGIPLMQVVQLVQATVAKLKQMPGVDQQKMAQAEALLKQGIAIIAEAVPKPGGAPGMPPGAPPPG